MLKYLATFALVLFACGPASAQMGGMGGGMGGMGGGMGGMQNKPIDQELLEIEQEVDKASLKEALTMQRKDAMHQFLGGGRSPRREENEKKELAAYIAELKKTITDRDAELKKIRAEALKAGVNRAQAAASAPKVDREEQIEKLEKAQVEVQLLQAQIGLLQDPLNDSINAVAAAEQAAADDEAKRPQAEEARKKLDKIKSRFIDLGKRLKVNQEEVGSLQSTGVGMGGMGGGFR